MSKSDYKSGNKLIPFNFTYMGQNFDKVFPACLKLCCNHHWSQHCVWHFYHRMYHLSPIQKNLLLFKELFLSLVYIMYLLFLLISGWLKMFLMQRNVSIGIIPWIVIKWAGESKKCFLIFSEINFFCERINMKIPTEAFIYFQDFWNCNRFENNLSCFYCIISPLDRSWKAHCKLQIKALVWTNHVCHSAVIAIVTTQTEFYVHSDFRPALQS